MCTPRQITNGSRSEYGDEYEMSEEGERVMWIEHDNQMES